MPFAIAFTDRPSAIRTKPRPGRQPVSATAPITNPTRSMSPSGYATLAATASTLPSVARSIARYRIADPTAPIASAPIAPSSHRLAWKRGTRARTSKTIPAYAAGNNIRRAASASDGYAISSWWDRWKAQ